VAEDFDRKEFEYLMGHKARLPAFVKDPRVIAHFDALFQRNGWVPEAGLNAAETFVEYAKALRSDNLDGERRPFEGKWDDARLYAEVAKRANIGTASEIRQVVEKIHATEIHDDLLARQLQRDLRNPIPPPSELDQRRIEDESSRHNHIRNQIEEHWSEVERQRAARDANHREAAAPKPAGPPPSPPSLSETISNAFDAHAGGEE
jgi:hypothetical protein